MKRQLSLAMFLVIGSVLCQAAQAGMYKVQTIDLTATPVGISDAGQIIANAQEGRSYYWSDSTDVIELSMRMASHINNDGYIVGISNQQNHRAVVWSYSTSQVDIGPGWAISINDDGDIVGMSEAEGHYKEGFVRDAETREIAYLGTHLPADINNNGTIIAHEEILTSVGWAQLPGYATDINNNGQVVGVLTVPVVGEYPYEEHVFLWNSPSDYSDLGLLSGDARCTVGGINDLGQIVGNSFNRQNVSRPFTWSLANGFVDLTTVDSSFYGASIYGINNLGQIVGVSADGKVAIWTPVPEPSSVFVLFVGIASLGGFTLKRKRG